MIPVPLQPKTCIRCKETKQVMDFYSIIKAGKSNITSTCKECKKIERKSDKWIKKHGISGKAWEGFHMPNQNTSNFE
jgi:hypothetical protein